MIKFTIPGEPKTKARHRTTKSGHTYTPKTTVEYENWVKLNYIDAKNKQGFEIITEPIRVTIKCYFPIPKSYSNNKKEMARNGDLKHTKKPDTDNIAKSTLDALNQLAYHDDKQVFDLRVIKYYSDEPRTEVILEEV